MRRYTLAQLEALRSIVSFGTFQAAADHLNVTQPTISLRIRELELIVGYALLRRSGGKGELTAEGSIFYRYVDRLTRTLNEMDRHMRTRDPLQGLLRLGASDAFAISCLPELLSKLETTYPNVRVELTIRDSTSLAELLNAKMLDIAFMAETPMEQHVHIHPLAHCQMAWFGDGLKQATSQYHLSASATAWPWFCGLPTPAMDGAFCRCVSRCRMNLAFFPCQSESFPTCQCSNCVARTRRKALSIRLHR